MYRINLLDLKDGRTCVLNSNLAVYKRSQSLLTVISRTFQPAAAMVSVPTLGPNLADRRYDIQLL